MKLKIQVKYKKEYRTLPHFKTLRKKIKGDFVLIRKEQLKRTLVVFAQAQG